MALKYLSHLETLNIDMQGYELQNAVVHTLTTATRPAAPTSGQIIYNSSTGSLEVYNGSAWVSASGDITSVSVSSGAGLTGSASGTSGAVSGTIALDYAGTDNFILAAGAGTGNVTTAMHIAVSNASSNVDYFAVSALPFTDNTGTVTSVAASGSGGVTISGSPITTSGTLNIGLSNVPNSSLANDSVTITAGKGLQDGGAVALGGSVTMNVDYLGLDNIILAAATAVGTPIQPDYKILVSGVSNAEYYNVSDLPFTSNAGTVTSVAAAGNDGITVSGSPITSSGTITLGLANAGIANAKLANSDVTFGSTTVALGGTSTSIAGLTALDFVAGNRTIGASIGANSLTLAGSTSTVVIPGNLTVNGTTTTVNSNQVNIGDAIITLNSDETGIPSQDGGIEIERGTSANVQLVWDETNDYWSVGTESFSAATFIGNLTGNATSADTADKWDTARTITLGGDLTGSVSIDGSANVTLTATIAANSVALGTDTTGNYVATVSGSNGITVTGSGSEGAAVSVSGDNASTTAKGVVELATSTEAITGTDTARAVTPKAASDMVANRQAAMRVNDVIPAATLTHPITHGFGSAFGVTQGAAAPIIISYFDTFTGEQLMIDSVQVTVDTVEARLAAPHANDIFVSVVYAGA